MRRVRHIGVHLPNRVGTSCAVLRPEEDPPTDVRLEAGPAQSTFSIHLSKRISGTPSTTRGREPRAGDEYGSGDPKRQERTAKNGALKRASLSSDRDVEDEHDREEAEIPADRNVDHISKGRTQAGNPGVVPLWFRDRMPPRVKRDAHE
jgi:hypothetical protein